MSRNQIIAVASCALLCVVVYLFADTKKPAQVTATPAHTETDHPTETLDIETYIADVTAKITNDSLKKTVQNFQSANNYVGLIEAFSHLDKPIAVAHYVVLKAEASNELNDWSNAGEYNVMLRRSAPDDKVRNFLTQNILESYKHAVALDSANTEYRIRLASAYIESGSEPMQGVTMLMNVVRKDSNNVEAQLLLSRFGIVSGQFQKAIDRLEKVLYLQPQNSEALLMMGEAYNNMGNADKALDYLERCKQTVRNPDLKKEIDKYIQSIKKPS